MGSCISCWPLNCNLNCIVNCIVSKSKSVFFLMSVCVVGRGLRSRCFSICHYQTTTFPLLGCWTRKVVSPCHLLFHLVVVLRWWAGFGFGVRLGGFDQGEEGVYLVARHFLLTPKFGQLQGQLVKLLTHEGALLFIGQRPRTHQIPICWEKTVLSIGNVFILNAFLLLDSLLGHDTVQLLFDLFYTFLNHVRIFCVEAAQNRPLLSHQLFVLTSLLLNLRVHLLLHATQL